MIDFDDVYTFPDEIKKWVIQQKDFFYSNWDKEDFSEPWELEHKLSNMRIYDYPIIQNYIKDNQSMEVAVWHATRIKNIETYRSEGINIMSGEKSESDRKIRVLLTSVGLNEQQIDEVFEHIYFLWNRDTTTRTRCIHFFVNRNFVYNDDRMNNFASNLGGECVRWAIEAIDRNLYKAEPYKRLWMEGTPSIIKFRCQISELDVRSAEMLITEIAKYYISTELYGMPYDFEFTGMKNGKVESENILKIEEIENFIAMQEKYPDYKGFYDELK